MKNIPKDIEKYLIKDEVIEKHFKLRDCAAYASNKRLFVKKGNNIREFDYNHISSIEFDKHRSIGPIIGGIILLVIALIVWQWIVAIGAILLIVGLILIVAGFVPTNQVEMTVVGLAIPLKLKGDMVELDLLLKIVRDKRVNERTAEQKQPSNTDFAETIRKLSELRDEGILTQDEFEEKKKKLLGDSG